MLLTQHCPARRFQHSFPLARWVQHLILLGSLPWYFQAKKGDFFIGCLFCLAASNIPLQLQVMKPAHALKPCVTLCVRALHVMVPRTCCGL